MHQKKQESRRGGGINDDSVKGRLSGITTAALVLLVSRLQQERVEQLQELHHQASSTLRDKDINSERQEVDAVHEEVQGEAKSGKSRPSNHSSAK